MTPCKANKCILYPACQSKTYIDCPEIRSFIQSLFNVPYSKEKVWKIVNKDLKKMICFKGFPSGMQDTIHHKDGQPNTGLTIEYTRRKIK